MNGDWTHTDLHSWGWSTEENVKIYKEKKRPTQEETASIRVCPSLAVCNQTLSEGALHSMFFVAAARFLFFLGLAVPGMGEGENCRGLWVGRE